ncbi:hypothetical protein AMATHDRAFT_196723 [Amanita thiersii Skay4041]|uniref:RING-type E3 ubiquitin transferase n=1 Tax=Amanita thiersii Skay4041 TaxID=703135 RepID=A0A2A9NCK9_9AGAR|nr:hypothetical protein AMATHDRAFT_196723 [Amanita thiersii Skay4041]
MKKQVEVEEGEGGEGGEDVCFICAEPIKYYSLSACNHRTCHVCALRLRALYKKTDCTFCKEPQPTVVFTTSVDKPYAEYDLKDIPHRDLKLNIHFETQDMMEETLILLRFNCPDQDCEYTGKGWGDLRLHTRAVHGRLMCDLCIRNKKVFSHEHALYPSNVLPLHLPSMNQRYRANVPRDQVEGGVHPLCEFCRECFFGDDELFAHCREKHEECFICKRNDIRNQYFQNYESLERHFYEAHHPCTQSQCLAQKFVVFGSIIDLKAHMVDEHGADMTSRDKKDARRVVAEFTFDEVGGGRQAQGRREHHEREREPPPRSRPPSFAPTAPSSTRALALMEMGGQSVLSTKVGRVRRREAFGTQLTVDGGSGGASPNQTASRELSRTPTPPRDDVDPAVAERHATFIARLGSLAANPMTAVPAVKAAIRSYRASESSARDLISTMWNTLDRNLEHAASIVNAFVDLLDEEEKKQDLLSSWKGFAIEQRQQFPELVPTAIGGGYAAIATGRVLNVKHSTASRSSQKSSRVWDRVARAAGSSSSSSSAPFSSVSGTASSSSSQFPPLHAAASSSSNKPIGGGQRGTTPWTFSSTFSSSNNAALAAHGGLAGPTSTSRPTESKVQVVPAPSSTSTSTSSARIKHQHQQQPPRLNASQFPELPGSSSWTKWKQQNKVPVSGNTSLRNILGQSGGGGHAVSAWQSGPPPSGAGGVGKSGGGEEEGAGGGGKQGKGKKGKKGKGKQKETLFKLGSFPT